MLVTQDKRIGTQNSLGKGITDKTASRTSLALKKTRF
jgi:hypothetical protein